MSTIERRSRALLPDAVLDHQATALRSRLGRPADHAQRERDAAGLANVESELQRRTGVQDAAAREAHGGVMLCKRVADLPGKDVHGAEHCWLQTARKSVGHGTGHVGEPTGPWIPGLNDCHTVVKAVISKCHDETIANALASDAASRPANGANGGVRR